MLLNRIIGPLRHPSLRSHAHNYFIHPPGTRLSQQTACLTGCIASRMCSYIKVYTLERALSQGELTRFPALSVKRKWEVTVFRP